MRKDIPNKKSNDFSFIKTYFRSKRPSLPLSVTEFPYATKTCGKFHFTTDASFIVFGKNTFGFESRQLKLMRSVVVQKFWLYNFKANHQWPGLNTWMGRICSGVTVFNFSGPSSRMGQSAASLARLVMSLHE